MVTNSKKKQSIRFHRKILFRVKNDNNQENFSKKNDFLNDSNRLEGHVITQKNYRGWHIKRFDKID